MTFAKQAADLLASEEAEDERGKARSHWRDYLATALGLGGLGAAGYLAYKNWPSLSGALDHSTGTPSKLDQANEKWQNAGAISRFLGKKPVLDTKGNVVEPGKPGIGPATIGGTLGALGPEIMNALPGKFRLPWDARAGSSTLAGLARASRGGYKGTELADAIKNLDTQIGGSKTPGGDLAREIDRATRPTATEDFNHPLRLAYELQTGKKFPGNGLWDKAKGLFNGSSVMSHVSAGLRRADELAQPQAPVKTEQGPNGLRLKPGQAPINIDLSKLGPKPPAIDPARAELAAKVRAGMDTNFNRMRAADLGNQMEAIRGLKSKATENLSPRRMLVNGAIGAGLGLAANQTTGL